MQCAFVVDKLWGPEQAHSTAEWFFGWNAVSHDEKVKWFVCSACYSSLTVRARIKEVREAGSMKGQPL